MRIYVDFLFFSIRVVDSFHQETYCILIVISELLKKGYFKLYQNKGHYKNNSKSIRVPREISSPPFSLLLLLLTSLEFQMLSIEFYICCSFRFNKNLEETIGLLFFGITWIAILLSYLSKSKL
jgi:hypothetical protein